MSPRIHNAGFSGAIQTGSCSANIQELRSVLSASHPHAMAQREPGRNPPRKRQGICKCLLASPLQFSEPHRKRLHASTVGSGPETGNLQRSQKRSREANGIWDGLTERPFHAQLEIPPASSCSFWSRPESHCKLSVVQKLMRKPVVSEDRGLTPLCTQPSHINLFDVIRS